MVQLEQVIKRHHWAHDRPMKNVREMTHLQIKASASLDGPLIQLQPVTTKYTHKHAHTHTVYIYIIIFIYNVHMQLIHPL